jgi:hypothetical protein
MLVAGDSFFAMIKQGYILPGCLSRTGRTPSSLRQLLLPPVV